MRAALQEAAGRRVGRTSLREEARRLAADEEDRAALQAVREQMGELSPPWRD